MIIMKYFRIALLAVALMPFTINNVGIAQTQHHQRKKRFIYENIACGRCYP